MVIPQKKSAPNTENGIEIPRDREGEFEPALIKKRQKGISGIEERIIGLYAKGVSVRDIQAHLNRLYGVDISPTLIPNATNKLMPLIRECQSRPLQNVYAAVFPDAIHFKVRQEGHIVNKAAYGVMGIDLGGCRDVLGMWIGEREGSKFWPSVLNELKNRGVGDVLICCADNLTGFSDAIRACIRTSIRYVPYKDTKKLLADLKPV